MHLGRGRVFGRRPREDAGFSGRAGRRKQAGAATEGKAPDRFMDHARGLTRLWSAGPVWGASLSPRRSFFAKTVRGPGL